MKITRLVTYAVEIPLKPERRMISSLGEHTISRYVIVRVETDAGVDGVGEATVMPRWSGETVWGTKALIDRVFAPLLIGLDPHDVAGIDELMDRACAHNWFTKSAIEMALWDIAGKEAGQPIYKLLGGPHRPLDIRCRFSMGAYEPDRARRRAAELVRDGFTTIKVKVGGDIARSVERVRIVRETIGPDLEITIDANCGFDAPAAIEAMRQMAPYNVSLFEQPTPDGDFAGMAEVRRAIAPATLVMADDILFDMADAQELVRNAACDLMSLYPGKNGGIRKAKEIAEFAERHGIPCSIGSNLEWDIGTAAMGHFVVGCRNLQIEKFPGDVLGPEYHEFRIVKDPLPIRGPVVTLSDRPGLGVDVDWGLVERHQCN